MKAYLLNRILIGLAFLGLFIAGVLSIEAGLNLAVPCGPSGGCARVAADPSSKFFGIPVAYFGVAGYAALAFLAVFRTTMPANRWKTLVNVGYLFAAAGTLVSLWLQYQSIMVIHATCLWCLSSAITMIVTMLIYGVLAQDVDRLPSDSEPDPEGIMVEERVPLPVLPEFKLSGISAGIALVGVLVVGSNMKKAGEAPSAPPKEATVAQLIPPGSHSIGSPDAKVTIVEFADICCPACQRVSPKVKAFVIAHAGKIRMVYHHYPLQQIHPEAQDAAAISECAADDNRFWEFVEAVMSLQRQPKDIFELLDIAKKVGLDKEAIQKRLLDSNDPIYSRIDRDLQSVKTLGINSTPTFFLVLGSKVDSVLGPGNIIDALTEEKVAKLYK